MAKIRPIHVARYISGSDLYPLFRASFLFPWTLLPPAKVTFCFSPYAPTFPTFLLLLLLLLRLLLLLPPPPLESGRTRHSEHAPRTFHPAIETIVDSSAQSNLDFFSKVNYPSVSRKGFCTETPGCGPMVAHTRALCHNRGTYTYRRPPERVQAIRVFSRRYLGQ